MIKNITNLCIPLAAILILGCGKSTVPTAPTAPTAPTTTGSIEITVSTKSAAIDLDPDGYSVMIDTAVQLQAIGTNTTVTIGSLSTGRHFVALIGVAANCFVIGSQSPRYVDVIADKASPVSFPVTCTPLDDGGWWDW